MDFDLSREQEALRERIEAFAERELAPGYLARARMAEYPAAEVRHLGGLGVLSLVRRDGGALDAGVAAEAIARHDVNLAMPVVFSAIWPLLVKPYASAEVVRTVGDSVGSGAAVVALGLTEPNGGSDARNLETTAERVDGGWRLSGIKSSISNSATARHAVVVARADAGPTAFFVDLDDPRVTRNPYSNVGYRPWGRGELTFGGVVVSDQALIGEPGRALRMIGGAFDFNRAIIGLICIAAALHAIEQAARRASERIAFGRPLLAKQGIAFPLVEHLTHLEAARLACLRTLWLRDRGRPHTAEAAMCKWWAPKLARDALHDCLLVWGHEAYRDEHPVSQVLMDVMGSEIADGTAQIQKILIARERFGRDPQPL